IFHKVIASASGRVGAREPGNGRGCQEGPPGRRSRAGPGRGGRYSHRLCGSTPDGAASRGPTAALQEAQHEATSKKTTAKQTRAVVRRRQEATTVTPERDGHLKEAEVARAALPTRLSRLFALLEGLATFPDIEQLLLDIPPDCY